MILKLLLPTSFPAIFPSILRVPFLALTVLVLESDLGRSFSQAFGKWKIWDCSQTSVRQQSKAIFLHFISTSCARQNLEKCRQHLVQRQA